MVPMHVRETLAHFHVRYEIPLDHSLSSFLGETLAHFHVYLGVTGLHGHGLIVAYMVFDPCKVK